MLENARPLILALLLVATAVAPAAAASLDGPAGRAPVACLAQAPPGLASGDTPAPPILYAVPDDLLADGRSPIRVEIRVDGERYIEERFTIHAETVARARAQSEGWARRPGDTELAPGGTAGEPDAAVFELLAERPEMRARVHELAAAGHRVEVEVEVGGRSAFGGTLDELIAAGGDLLRRQGPPVATDAVAQAFAITADAQEPPSGFYICGDGSCGGGTPPTGENCESCPQDCGGPCSICGNGYCGGTETCSSCQSDCGACPTCPTSLGTEERFELLNVYYYATQCRDGAFGRAYYTDTQYYYKRYLVELVRQCNGSVTETVVPGSTSYHWGWCWTYSGGFCSSSWGSAFPTC